MSFSSEKKSHAAFYLDANGVDKDKFAEYVTAELGQDESGDETASQRALNQFDYKFK